MSQIDMFEKQKELDLLGDVQLSDLLRIFENLLADHKEFVEAAQESGSPILYSEKLQKKASDLLADTNFGWRHSIMNIGDGGEFKIKL